MPLPLYMLRRLAMPGGVRLPKFVSFKPIDGECFECKKPVYMTKINGHNQTEGYRRNGQLYHYNCLPSEPSQYRNFGAGHGEVPSGNLSNEEYRYWIGSPYPASTLAICRACRTQVWTGESRLAHSKDDKFVVGGERCAKRLTMAYAILLREPQCVVCKAQRYGSEKWGVPLCNKNDCLRKWKFEEDRWVFLEAELEKQVKRAAFLARRKGEAVTNIRQPIGRWCQTCSMRTDEEGHELTHLQMTFGGGVYND